MKKKGNLYYIFDWYVEDGFLEVFRGTRIYVETDLEVLHKTAKGVFKNTWRYYAKTLTHDFKKVLQGVP